MSVMNAEQLKSHLERLLQLEQGKATPTLLERVSMTSPEEWGDDEWEFANQRGLIPAHLQSEYVRRATAKRHAAEMAALEGQDVSANFGGNLPSGTVTESLPAGAQMGVGLGSQGPSADVSAQERLHQLDKLESQIAVEREALENAAEAEAEAAEGEHYERMTVPKLQAEVSRRNDGREVEDHVVPDSSRKADLVAALEEDDAVQEQKAASQPS